MVYIDEFWWTRTIIWEGLRQKIRGESWGVLYWMWMVKELGDDGEGMRRLRTVSVGFKCWFWSGNMMSWLGSCQSNNHREQCILSSVLQGNRFSSIFSESQFCCATAKPIGKSEAGQRVSGWLWANW